MSIENQIERYQKLQQEEKKIENEYLKLQAEIELNQKQYEAAIKEMEEQFGVSSLEDLRALRKKMHQENETTLAHYEEQNERNKQIIQAAIDKKNQVQANIDGE